MLRKKILPIIAVLLIGILAVLYFSPSEETAIEDGNIRFYIAEEEIATISYDEIMQLRSYRRQLMVHSTSGDFVADFRGAMLSDVLDLAVPNWAESYDTIKVMGADGYYTDLTQAEILAENNAFLMYSDSEEPLMSIAGESQSGRLVVIGDDFGQRFTNYVNEIHFQIEETIEDK